MMVQQTWVIIAAELVMLCNCPVDSFSKQRNPRKLFLVLVVLIMQGKAESAHLKSSLSLSSRKFRNTTCKQ